MTKIALLAAVCCAFAAPAFAEHGGTTVVVKTVNVSGISQGGNGSGQANAAIVAQGTVAIVAAPTNAPTISNHAFGVTSVGGHGH